MAKRVSAAAKAAREDAVAALRAAAREAGVALPGAAYTVGERHVFTDDGRCTVARDPYAKLPEAGTALAGLAARVAAENRHDITVYADRLRLDPATGRMGRQGPGKVNGGGRAYLPHVLGQIARLLTYAPTGAGRYWLDRPAPYRAAEFNSVMTEAVNNDDTVVLRFRTPNAPGQQPEAEHIFAAVSEAYKAYDPDQLARDLLLLLDGARPLARAALRTAEARGRNGKTAEAPPRWTRQSRARVVYHGVRCGVTLLQEVPSGAGRLAVDVYTADDTSSSVHVTARFELWSGVRLALSRKAASVVHHGRESRYIYGLAKGLVEAARLAGPFAAQWASRDYDLPVDLAGWTAAVRHLCGDEWREQVDAETGRRRKVQAHKGWLRIQGVEPGQLAQAILDAHAALEGARPKGAPPVKWSIAGLAHAIGHCALTGGWSNERAARLQEAAEALLISRPRVVEVWLGVRKGSAGVNDVNQELNAELSRLRGRREAWEAEAEAAEAEGDEQTAKEARERAALLAVQGDMTEEQQAR